MEQVISYLLESGGVWSAACIAIGWWGWNNQKAKDRIQEQRIEDTKLTIEAAHLSNAAAEKQADALMELSRKIEMWEKN